MIIHTALLPSEIRESARTVVWRWETRKGKRTKPPYQAHAPARPASTIDATTWASFDVALAAVEDGKADGLGVVFNGEDGLIGIDLDRCRDPQTGIITPGALAIIKMADSYAEVSPSGTGVHILLRGQLPPGRRKGPAGEIYDRARFFTVSGEHVPGTPRTIEERTADELAALHARLFGSNGNGHRPLPRPILVMHDDDDAGLLARAHAAKNGAKFSALWAGDHGGYPSASEADLALCDLLAFWTGRDAARIDRLFRQSGLMRAKWDTGRGGETYGAITIATAIAGVAAQAMAVAVSSTATHTAAPSPYAFPPAVEADHFIARWTAYVASRTDAAHAYHEAAALVLLATATPTVRAHLSPFPNGLATNLYVLYLGDSTTSRKSTSKDFARDAQDRALPGSVVADQFSPEAFVERLAGRPRNSSTLYVDEFADLLDKLHHAKHMAGLRGLFLTVYAGNDYLYQRHSKRGKGGEKLIDEDRVIQPHLSILGATTPAVFDVLTQADVISGLLPRFAIIMPATKPPRRPLFAVGVDVTAQGNALVEWVHRLHTWATTMPRAVHFEPHVLEQIDVFAAQIERDASQLTDTAKAMLQRLMPMSVKLSMLVAAGRPEAPGDFRLDVQERDAAAACQIAARWQHDALAFASRIGETDFERHLQRCRRLVRTKGRVSRSVVARQAHVERKILDSIRDTLIDRGAIIVEHVKAPSGPHAEYWRAAPDADEADHT